MIDFWPQAGLSLIGTWLLTWWMHSTLLIGGVWLVLKLRPVESRTLQERLWKTALLGAFLTASVQTAGWWRSPLAVSLSSFLPMPRVERRDVSRSAPQVQVAPLPREMGWATASPEPEERVEAAMAPRLVMRHLAPEGFEERFVQPPTQDVVFATVSPPPQPIFPTAPPPYRNGMGLMLSSLGVLGVVFLMLGMCRWWGYFRDLLADSRQHASLTSGTAIEVLRELQKEAGYRRSVRLLTSETEQEPMASGWFRPTILLPRRALEECSRGELKSLLAHELAHLVRQDPIWLAGTFLLQLAFPFQPLLWLARRRWQQVAELECDALAVEWTADPIALAECLTRVLSWKLPPSRSLVAATLSQGAQISQRVENLLEDEPAIDPWRGRWRRVMGPLTCVVLAGMTLVGPQVTGLLPMSRALRADEKAKSMNSEVPENKSTDMKLTSDPFHELHSEIQQLESALQALALESNNPELRNNPLLPADERNRLQSLLDRVNVLTAQGRKFIEKGQSLPRSLQDLPHESLKPVATRDLVVPGDSLEGPAAVKNATDENTTEK